ncbi:MAG: hypothetical protein KA285_02480, partial [Bacteroidia bacterium]|nr:hypothetical protein [Bacteroidia bacterium]
FHFSVEIMKRRVNDVSHSTGSLGKLNINANRRSVACQFYNDIYCIQLLQVKPNRLSYSK